MSRPLEKRELRIGVTPLTDSAPIVAAHERGFFAAEGLEVELSSEPSWANIRDKLAAGVLDAAHALAPLPIAATLGIGPLQEPMGTALSLGLGGNAITVSLALWDEMRAAAPEAIAAPATRGRALARVVANRIAEGARPLRLATVFPVSMHAYELRHWLASVGVVRACGSSTAGRRASWSRPSSRTCASTAWTPTGRARSPSTGTRTAGGARRRARTCASSTSRRVPPRARTCGSGARR